MDNKNNSAQPKASIHCRTVGTERRVSKARVDSPDGTSERQKRDLVEGAVSRLEAKDEEA